MLCEAQSAGLMLDPQKVVAVLGGEIPYVPPDPQGKLHKSLHGFWWLGEVWPKLYHYPFPVPGQAMPDWKRSITVNLGRARLIPNGVHIHQSVFDRMRDVAEYRPTNLPQQYFTEAENACELVPRPVIEQQAAAPTHRAI
jgi:hypothetical protein